MMSRYGKRTLFDDNDGTSANKRNSSSTPAVNNSQRKASSGKKKSDYRVREVRREEKISMVVL